MESQADETDKSVISNVMEWFGFRDAEPEERREENEVNIDERPVADQDPEEEVPTFDQFVEYFRRHNQELEGI